jgi:ParB family transcriptional regulator, chromosome partitioning protein
VAERFGPHVERLHAVAASPSRRLVAFGGARDVDRARASEIGSRVHVAALSKLEAASVAGADGAVLALAFAGDDLLLGGLSNGTILGWDTSSVGASAGANLPEVLRLDGAHRGAVRALAAAPAERGRGLTIASAGDDGALRIGVLEAADGAQRFVLVVERVVSARALQAVAIDPTGKTVATAGDDNVIRAWSIADAAQAAPREMPCGEAGIGSLCFTADGRIAAGCGDGSIQLCFLEGAVDAENRTGDAAHAGMVRGMAMSAELLDESKRPLPQRLFSIAEDGALKAWPLDTRRKPRTIELGARLTAMVLVPASRGAKPDRRGGTLVVVDDQRSIHVVTVNDQAEPSETVERTRSLLAGLREDLDASGVKVRLEAVEALAALPEDDARQLLDRALTGDGKPEVRKRAAEAMGRSGRRLSRPVLRQALGDSDASVRRAALDALVAIEAGAPLAPLRAALEAPHADMRSLALSRLPALRASSPLVPGLVAVRLSDDAAEVRRAALDALYALADGDALQPVRVAIQRGPADIRVEALLRLGRARLGHEPGAAALLEAALDDDSAEVRDRALLVAIGVRPRLAARVRAVDAELGKALDELEAKGRLADRWDSREGLPALTDDDLAPLFSALTCRHATTALRAARFLGALGDPRATGALLQLTREAETDVRRATIPALARAARSMPGDARITARLEWLLDDPDATVRANAFDALVELSPTASAAELLDLAALALGCAREDIRLRALPILVEFGGRGRHAGQRALTGKAGELLGRALDDENGKVRIQAFTTLWTWYSGDPRAPLSLGAACRHADVRKRVVEELARIKDRNPGHWADDLLVALIGDSTAEVGLAAYEVLTGKRDEAANQKPAAKTAARVELHRAALDAPRPEVRTAGCKGAPRSAGAVLRDRLVELVKETNPEVHLAAIEAIDRLVPDDAEGFALAFASDFYELRVRAAELSGKRRDARAVGPAKELLSIPPHHFNRPADRLRQRMARALADVGERAAIPFLVSLLEDPDPIVREMGARGLATSCRPGDEKPLADALSHADLPVRSWVAEGLARLGDDRAVPVLAGTLAHDHRPIRLGAILGFVALGADGVRGILQGLDDRDRDIQDLIFAVIVARDVALARAGQPPDLLLSALSSSSPEIRFGAARILEARMSGEDLGQVAQELVGPRKPEKASDMKEWPAEDERQRRLDAVIGALASDHPAQRYAAAQVLSLRGQALGFWREAGRLLGPTAADRPRIPYTTWEDDEAYQPRRKGWIRSLLGRGADRDQGADAAPVSGTERMLTVLAFAGAPGGRAVPPEQVGFGADDARKLVFGVHAGLLRQAPVRGESDETHRVRRDSIARLAALAASEDVGREAALPALRRALSDPHHLVRKAAMSALRGLYPESSLAPLQLALQATAADVGRAAVDEIVAAAMAGNEDARTLARTAIDAPVPEVRAHALSQMPRLFAAGSLEPWLIALDCRHADVRLAVVDRLLIGLEAAAGGAHGDALQVRASAALARAMESDHEDLRLKAAVALAGRGDARTVDVLAGMLRSEDQAVAQRATTALVELAHARPLAPDAADVASSAAATIAARIEDDPDRTANRLALIDAIGRIGSPAGSAMLLALLDDDDAEIRARALTTLLLLARQRDELRRALPARPVPGDASTRQVLYNEQQALTYLGQSATRPDTRLRLESARALRDIEDRGAEELLARLVEDREDAVRVAAAESLAFRAEHFPGASMDVLASALRGGRRELVLPAAMGLASRRRPEAFQALLLVFKAGEQAERGRAVVGLGQLGDRRALEELEPLLASGVDLPEDDAALAPAAAEALGRLLPHLRDDDAAHPDEQRRVRESLFRLASEGAPEIRKRALTGLRHAATAGNLAEARHRLERLVADAYDEAALRAHAAEELGKLGHPDAEAVLADALSEDDTRLRRTALEALERIFPRDKLENRTRTSLLALRSRHEDISARAASFLASEGDPATLVARLASIDSDDIRRRLRRGLIRRGACPVQELVAVLAAKGADPKAGAEERALADAAWIAGAAARRELGKDDQKALRAAMVQATDRAAAAWRALRAGAGGTAERAREDDSHDGGETRLGRAEEAWRACLWAALRLDADAGRAARDALGSAPAPATVRREALHFLGEHGKPADLDLVRPMLADADAAVRAAAASVYAALAPERARDAIADMAVPDSAALQPLAAAVLAKDQDARRLVESATGRRVLLPVMLGQKRTAPLLALARTSGKDPARLVALASLGRIGGSDAETTLTAIFRDQAEDAAVRAAAFRALRRLQRRAAGDARFRPADQP